MSDYWFDAEAIASERMDADIEQADLEAAGREYGRSRKRMVRLRAAGDLAGAARACMHGGGYPLNSPAALNMADPRAGQQGFRCNDCGSVTTEYRGAVLIPCDMVSR